jgi:hypothetical protein
VVVSETLLSWPIGRWRFKILDVEVEEDGQIIQPQ